MTAETPPGAQPNAGGAPADEDLLHNRQGLLSPAQRAILAELLFVLEQKGLRSAAELDLREGRVVAVDGRAELIDRSPGRPVSKFDYKYQDAYNVVAPGYGRLELQGKLRLLPGPYRFYVAPRCGLVMHAEPLAAGDHVQLYRAALLAAQRLSEDDIASNERGVMGSGQRRIAVREGTRRMSPAIAMALLALASFLLELVGCAQGRATSVVSASFLGLTALLSLVGASALVDALVRGRVDTVEGVVSPSYVVRHWSSASLGPHRHFSRLRAPYLLEVGGVELDGRDIFRAGLFWVIAHSSPVVHRAYVTRRSKIVVAVVPVAETAARPEVS